MGGRTVSINGWMDGCRWYSSNDDTQRWRHTCTAEEVCTTAIVNMHVCLRVQGAKYVLPSAMVVVPFLGGLAALGGIDDDWCLLYLNDDCSNSHFFTHCNLWYSITTTYLYRTYVSSNNWLTNVSDQQIILKLPLGLKITLFPAMVQPH